MQVIQSHQSLRPPVGAIVVGLVVGGFLLLGGLFLGWIAYATPALNSLNVTGGRASAAQLALGAVAWSTALVAPPSFAIVGALRLSAVARAVTARPKKRTIHRLAHQMSDDYTAAHDLRLPDGRPVRNVVLGPFGLAVFTELPHKAELRHAGMSWEIKAPNGRWMTIENPVERTGREADRVRRWIGATERDFVVKVYAAVLTDDPTITRTTACTVIAPDQLPSWLASLPASRILTPDRMSELTDALRSVA